ncbi:MAG: D-alanyl-D-alanine carboxypeptidase [Lachnospiraceae bacterium]|nr:D-alanyl-D-alanine carboxypeptidase [Lachnospiraceae bacterium]
MVSVALFSVLLLLTGCGQSRFDIPYSIDSEVSSFRVINLEEERGTAVPFASGLCVVNSNIESGDVDMAAASGAGLFDIKNCSTLYAKNPHEKLYPASLTKVMTALVAIKNGSNDMLLTASANVKIQESGAQVCGIKEGDQMTLDQALHLLLINSANDAAVLIAEGIAGSVEAFADMMNEEALLLGATNTHFVNPHGLPDDNHYTTVYDMYLIMNEAINYTSFNDIIHMDSYTTVYTDKNGASKEITVNNTNRYIQGTAQAPSGITVMGGKTGTTNAAGHCLILLSRDSSSNPYISIIMRAESGELLYSQMTDLLEEINN